MEVDKLSENILELKGITKSFGTVKVLKDITFSLKREKFLVWSVRMAPENLHL